MCPLFRPHTSLQILSLKIQQPSSQDLGPEARRSKASPQACQVCQASNQRPKCQIPLKDPEQSIIGLGVSNSKSLLSNHFKLKNKFSLNIMAGCKLAINIVAHFPPAPALTSQLQSRMLEMSKLWAKNYVKLFKKNPPKQNSKNPRGSMLFTNVSSTFCVSQTNINHNAANVMVCDLRCQGNPCEPCTYLVLFSFF
jgi:hypothetical protein